MLFMKLIHKFKPGLFRRSGNAKYFVELAFWKNELEKYIKWYDGLIDELGIFDTVLNAADVAELYGDVNPPPYPFGPVDTCTCPGATEDWEINMTDNCNITTACDLTTGTLSFVDEGWTICDATVNTTNMGDPGNNAVLYLNSSCVIIVN